MLIRQRKATLACNAGLSTCIFIVIAVFAVCDTRGNPEQFILPMFIEQFGSSRPHISTALEVARHVLKNATVILPGFSATISGTRPLHDLTQNSIPYGRVLNEDEACSFVDGRCASMIHARRRLQTKYKSLGRAPKVLITQIDLFEYLDTTPTMIQHWLTVLKYDVLRLLPSHWEIHQPVQGWTPPLPTKRANFFDFMPKTIVWGKYLSMQGYSKEVAEHLVVRFAKWTPTQKRTTSKVIAMWKGLTNATKDFDVHIIALYFAPYHGYSKWWRFRSEEAVLFTVDVNKGVKCAANDLITRVGGIDLVMHWRTETGNATRFCAARALEALNQLKKALAKEHLILWLMTDVNIDGNAAKSNTLKGIFKEAGAIVEEFAEVAEAAGVTIWTTGRAIAAGFLPKETPMVEQTFLDASVATIVKSFWFWAPESTCAREQSRFTGMVREMRKRAGLGWSALAHCGYVLGAASLPNSLEEARDTMAVAGCGDVPLFSKRPLPNLDM